MTKILVKEKNNNPSVSKKIISVTVTLLVIGTGLYLLLDSSWSDYIFAHVGAIGLMSLLGFFSGKIAEKKGYGFLQAYFLGVSIPVFLGAGSALLWPILKQNNHVPCGGSIALSASLLMLLFYAVTKRKRIGLLK